MPIPTSPNPAQKNYDPVPYMMLATPAEAQPAPVTQPVMAEIVAVEPATALPVAALDVQNPYASPSTGDLPQYPELSKQLLPLKRLHRINWFLRYTQFATAIYITSLVLLWRTAPELVDPIKHGLPVALSGFALWVLVTLLAYHARGMGHAIFTGIFFSIPIAGIFVVMGIIDRARKVLKEHGFNRGILEMEFNSVAFEQLSQNSTQIIVIAEPVKKERSSSSLVFTYVLFGLLVGLIAISVLAS